MNNQSNSLLEKVLKYIVIFGSYLVVFMPLLVVPQSYFPYIIQKTIYLRILIEVIFVAYLVLALKNSDYRPQKSLILWSVVAYFSVMVITTFTSLSFARSWWGNWERSLGTFNLLHYFLWFLALISVFKQTKNWNRILNLSVVTSLLIGLYSIAQRFGFSFILQSGLERVNGTLGNASFLASYNLLHIFIALFFAVERKSWPGKIYYFAIALVNLFVLLLTGTRGALLALFASLIAFLGLSLWQKSWRQKTIKVLIGLTLFLIIAAGILFYFKNTDVVKENYWLRRFTDFSLEDNTIQTRLHSWSWGLKGFRDNLIFGVGQENYQIVFNKYFTADFYDYSSSEIWFDRAHNNLVDQAATMGIFGLLSYIFIFGAVVYYLVDFRKKGVYSANTFMVLSLLFSSYFIQNIFVFDSLNTYIVFFAVVAYVHFLQQKVLAGQLQPLENKRHLPRIPAALSGPVLVLGFVILLLTVNVPEIKANNYVYDAYAARTYSEYDNMLADYQAAKEISINKLDLPVLLSSSLNELIASGTEVPKERKVADLKRAVEWMKEAIALDPDNMFLYYLQSKNYALLVEQTLDSEYLDLGVAAAEKAQELSPGRVRPLWMLAQLYLYANEAEQALKYLDQAESLNPRLPDTYYYKAIIYKSLGESEKFFQQYDKLIALRYDFFSVAQIREVLSHYDELGDVKSLIYLEEQVTRLSPQDPNHWVNLVDLLKLDGQYERALTTLKRAAEAIPSFSNTAYQYYQEIQQLIQEQNNDQSDKK